MEKSSISVKTSEIAAYARICKRIRGNSRHLSTSTITTQPPQVRRWMNQKPDLKMKISRKALSPQAEPDTDSNKLEEKT